MVKLSLIQFDIYIVETEISWVTDKIVWNEQVNGVGQGGRLQNLLTGTLQDLNYKYDAAGNIVELRDDIAVETSAYGYDTLNRLTSWNLNGTTETYGYNASTGNLETKAGVTLQYNDAAHVHAATNAGSNTYQYDANGNQTTRVIGADTYTLIYNAENQLIEVKKNGLSIAQFTFDGDGRRVKSVVNGVTTYFAGPHYEFNDTTDEVTKYYFANTGTIAVRKYVVPQNMTLTYLLGDHLGSTSLAVDASTGEAIETRYKPWGEVRYTTPNMTLPTRYTYTGQYSYIADEATDIGNSGFGLMFYNARWYDPAIGRFAQADTVVPDTKNINLVVGYSELELLEKLNTENAETLEELRGEKQTEAEEAPLKSQVLDRYSYANNNPAIYNDPSGHCADPASGTFCLALAPTGPVGWVIIGILVIVDVVLIVTAVNQAVASTEEATTSVEMQGEYVPPGLVGAARDAYREALHRYKDAHGLGAKDNVPKDILDQIADLAKKGVKPSDIVDRVPAPPEEDEAESDD